MNRQQRRAVRQIALKCSSCGAMTWADKARDWNFTMKRGQVVGTLCPDCQTPEQNAEAEINHATLDYSVDGFGRIIGKAKVASE